MRKIERPHWWTPQKRPKKLWSVLDTDAQAQLFLDDFKGKDYYTLSTLRNHTHTLYRLTFSEFCIMKMEGNLMELKEDAED